MAHGCGMEFAQAVCSDAFLRKRSVERLLDIFG